MELTTPFIDVIGKKNDLSISFKMYLLWERKNRKKT